MLLIIARPEKSSQEKRKGIKGEEVKGETKVTR